MPEPEGIPCPICGEPLAEGAEACRNCGAGVSETALRNLTRALGIDSAKAQELLRKGVRSPDDLGGRSVGDVLKEKEPSVLYLCPECGAFVSSADKTCGKCGARLAEEAMDLDKFLEAGGTRACPACGETIPAEAVVCPACQTTILSEAGGPEPTMVLCQNCGATVLEGLDVCDTCGEPMRGIAGARPGPREKGPVCPSCGAVLEPDATVCEMCGRELGSPAEAPSTAPAAPDSEMQAIDRLLEEGPDETEVAAGLDALANEVEAEEAVLELEGPLVCDTCGEPMRGIAGARPGPREKGPVCPSCGAVLEPDATVCEMCGRELGSPAEAPSTAPAAPDSEMQAIDRLLEEGPDETEVAAGLDALANEVEAEEAVLELEGPLPRRRMKAVAELQIAKLVVPRAPRLSPVDRLRETALIATLATLVPAAYVAAVPSEVGRWAILALSVSILATALALAFLEFAPIRERWRDHAIVVVGGVLLLAVPVHNAARASLPEAADGALLVLGVALAVAGGAPFRRTPSATAPWLAALPAFVAAAAAMAVGAPAGTPAIAIGTWASTDASRGPSRGPRTSPWGRTTRARSRSWTARSTSRGTRAPRRRGTARGPPSSSSDGTRRPSRASTSPSR
ncbi:MAG: hypothetical protein E6K16_03395 [Methanobacteriota archaeon]|nr:MAG: hypothetical protein E6K16_03395 [Euryarchaeota archaeon]